MVSSGKSRTTGWTRAEYDRPVSLRSRASWIPARKSWASRIIGDLAVRPIAVSTSRSIEASVPSTISRVTGSTRFTRVAPAGSRSGSRTGRPRPGTRGGAGPWPRTPPPPPARRQGPLAPDRHGDRSPYRQIRGRGRRSEEHTSELQSPDHLVCRLLLEKKKKILKSIIINKKKKNKINQNT